MRSKLSKSQQRRNRQRAAQSVEKLAKYVAKHLNDESDRSRVISSVAALEERIELTIRKSLTTPMSKEHPLLDGPFAPISSLSAKLLFAKSIGLISDQFFSDLNAMRKIRNEFAHTFKPLTLDSPQIVKHLDSLSPITKKYWQNLDSLSSRSKYLAVFSILLANMDDIHRRTSKHRKPELEGMYVHFQIAKAVGMNIKCLDKSTPGH